METPTMMKKIGIALFPHELTAASRNELRVLVRRVKPQPPSKYTELYLEPQWLWSKSTSGQGAEQQDLWMLPKRPWQKGSILYWREAYWQDSREPDDVVIYDSTPEWGKYRDEREPITRSKFPCGTPCTREESMPLSHFWRKRPASAMPYWASRHRFTVTSDPIAKMARDLTEEEARGWGCWSDEDMPHIPDNGFSASPLDRAKHFYTSLHGPDSWERDWVWVGRVERIETK